MIATAIGAILVIALVAGIIAKNRRDNQKIKAAVRKMIDTGGDFDMSSFHPILLIALECQIQKHGGKSYRHGPFLHIERATGNSPTEPA